MRNCPAIPYRLDWQKGPLASERHSEDCDGRSLRLTVSKNGREIVLLERKIGAGERDDNGNV